MTTTTPNIKLFKPDFNISPWHDEINANFTAIDAIFKSTFGIAGLLGEWKNSTAVTVGQRYYDATLGFYYEVVIAHTTPAYPTTFAASRLANPTYWAPLDASQAIAAASDAQTALVDVIARQLDITTKHDNVVTKHDNVVAKHDIVVAAQLDVATKNTNVTTLSGQVTADKATVAADKAIVVADKAIVLADKNTVIADKAIVAADKAIVLADKNTVAADKATVAADKATTITNKNDAVTARIATEAARDATLAAFDNFDDRYLGNKAADPITDNDGNTLIAGTLYFNTTVESLRIYTGTVWTAAYIVGTDILLKSQNLNDLPDKATARANLGTNSAANLTADTVPDARLAAKYKAQQSYDAASNLNSLVDYGWNKLVGPANANLPRGYFYHIETLGNTDTVALTQVAWPYGNSGIAAAGLHMRAMSSASVWDATWEEVLFKSASDARYAQLSGATFTGSVNFNNYLNFTTYLSSLTAAAVFASSGVSGTVYLRPNGTGSVVNQLLVPSSGAPTIGGSAMHHDGNASRGAPDWVLEDQKSSGTAGGTSASGSWVTRTLNTEVRDPLGLVTISANQFVSTVDGWVKWSAPMSNSNLHQSRLFNVTDGVVVTAGTCENTTGSFASQSVGGGPIVAGKTYRIEHRCTGGFATTGLGVACSLGTEVFTRVEFWRS